MPTFYDQKYFNQRMKIVSSQFFHSFFCNLFAIALLLPLTHTKWKQSHVTHTPCHTQLNTHCTPLSANVHTQTHSRRHAVAYCSEQHEILLLNISSSNTMTWHVFLPHFITEPIWHFATLNQALLVLISCFISAFCYCFVWVSVSVCVRLCIFSLQFNFVINHFVCGVKTVIAFVNMAD